MATNPVLVAAGFVLFGETLPRAAGRLAGRGACLASAVALGHQHGGEPAPAR